MSNYGHETVIEFKSARVIGVSSSETFATLITFVPWGDDSGGYPKQVAVSGRDIYWRNGTSNSSWGPWQHIFDSSDPNDTWLMAHRVGEYLETDGSFNPNDVGGTWTRQPSVGPHTWLRTK
jgi:hypothetical protein